MLARSGPDEDTFEIPAAWVRKAEPFRGLRPAPDVAIDVAATRAAVAERRASREPHVQAHLTYLEDLPALGKLLRRHHVEEVADPFGAAVLLAEYSRSRTYEEPRDRNRLSVQLIDDLVLTHGVPFAALAGVALTLFEAASTGIVNRDRTWNDGVRPILTRLRAHLAAATDDNYDEAVRLLGKLRLPKDPQTEIAVSYLVPTEQSWVRADLATPPSSRVTRELWPMLLSSTTTAEDADAVITAPGFGLPERNAELLLTVAANLGASAGGPMVKLLDKGFGVATVKRIVGILAALPTDEAFTALVERLNRTYVEPGVLEAMGRYPFRAARILAARAKGSDAVARKCRELLDGHVRAHPHLTDQAAVPTAGDADLPAVLTTPPWQRRTRASRPPVITGLTPPSGLALRWGPGEQEEWSQLPLNIWITRYRDEDDLVKELESHRWPGIFSYRALGFIADAPPDVVRPHLGRFSLPENTGDIWADSAVLQRILARLGSDALDLVFRVVRARPADLAAALLPVEGAEVANQMATWLVRAPALRTVIRDWTRRHPDAAALGLIPAALGRPSKTRNAAEALLRGLGRANVRAAAVHYGAEVTAAVDALLDADPLDRLPAKIPAQPSWLDPTHLPPVLLRDRSAALPTEAVGNLATMLALCTPDDTYTGVEIVKAALDPTSAAEFAWALLKRWQSASFPRADEWVLQALGLLGDDETVRRLAPLVQKTWPKEGGRARAVAALDVFTAIGSDVALLHLHTIAEKAVVKTLKTGAREKITEIAERQGLSTEQLTDRLVPDFGLDRSGAMVLDYGPRRFTVGFDEQLRPVITDESGARLRTLPRPTAQDDPATYTAFRGLKKDVAGVAADQIRRLERAMVLGRRWTAAEHRTLFVDHPLLWHLTRRLVWVTFDDTKAFRVAEDRTLADADDNEITLPDDAAVGIAHPLHLGEHLATWTELFTDYEILQPFPQLGRDTRALTTEERQATSLDRLAGVTIPAGRVLGLTHRGWERGPISDIDIAPIWIKPTPGPHTITLEVSPGILLSDQRAWKDQQVITVSISENRPFELLDDITASELLRDLAYLRG